MVPFDLCDKERYIFAFGSNISSALIDPDFQNNNILKYDSTFCMD